jgi:hypothetical protein
MAKEGLEMVKNEKNALHFYFFSILSYYTG